MHGAQPPFSIVSAGTEGATPHINLTGWLGGGVAGDAVRVMLTAVMVTVAGRLCWPPAFWATIVYVAVAGTGIGMPLEFEVGRGPASSGSARGSAGEKLTEVASVVAQVNVVDAPATTVVGLALNCVICGTAGWATLTDTVWGGVLPPGPVATAV